MDLVIFENMVNKRNQKFICSRISKTFWRLVYIVIVTQTLMMSSCKQLTRSIEDTFKQPSEGQLKTKGRGSIGDIINTNYLSDAQYLRGAQHALKELPKFKGKALNVYSDIHFYDDGRVMLSIQDPDIPENIDSYTFKGGEWMKPEPVQVSRLTELSLQLLPLDSVDFGTVTSLFDYMQNQSKEIEGAEPVTHIYLIIRPTMFGIQWFASVRGIRGVYSLRALLSGEILKFERD